LFKQFILGVEHRSNKILYLFNEGRLFTPSYIICDPLRESQLSRQMIENGVISTSGYTGPRAKSSTKAKR